MRYALIDHSTLTATQRLLGQVPIKNLYVVDGDITAFEGLIQAILFYDHIFCIDDYKSEFRTQRNQYFDFIIPLAPTEFAYDEIIAAARQCTRDIMLRVEEGDVSDDDFRRFFDMLQMQTVFTRRMQSSHFFLTLNMLAGSSDDLTIEKYSALTEMIFSQLAAKDTVESDPSKGSACILFDSFGLRVNNGYRVGDKTYKVGRQVWAFASSLNWLSLRTAFYSLAAHSSGMEAVLHPIRHAFRLHLARRMLGMPTTTFEPLVSMLRDGIALTVREIVQAADPIINRMDLPIFTAYIATRTKNPHDFITEAHRLRGEAPIVEARRRLIDLEDLVEHGDRRSFVIEVNRLQREIEQAAQRLRAAYGVDTPQGVPVSTITSILNIPLQFKTGITLPDFGWKIPLPSRLSRLADRRGFKAVFRSVVDDLVSVERLGVLHEVIASAVVYEEHAAYYEQKQEDARYRGWNSGVKQWM